MCRWLAYIGKPVTPEQYLYEEQFSLISQSICARKSKSVVNGDGFGLGWFADKEEPGLFRDILPAWNDENLKSLACQIRSGLFMAHVRAATDTASNRTNCHPFKHENSLFIHNGQIGGYLLIRRALENLIPDHLFSQRIGTTDSEVIFLYIKALLERYSYFETTCKMIQKVISIMKSAGIKEAFRYTSAYSDGDKLYVIRYSSDKIVPTLFYNRTDKGWLLVSEPLDNQLDHWKVVPNNHQLELSRDCDCPKLTPLQF